MTITNKPEQLSHRAWFHYAKARMNDWAIIADNNAHDASCGRMVAVWQRQIIQAYTHLTKAEKASL